MHQAPKRFQKWRRSAISPNCAKREASTISKSCSSAVVIKRVMAEGSCWPSESRVTIPANPCSMAQAKPVRSAAPLPRLTSWLNRLTGTPAISVMVESIEPSFTTRTGNPDCNVSITTCLIVEAALYAGITMQIPTYQPFPARCRSGSAALECQGVPTHRSSDRMRRIFLAV